MDFSVLSKFKAREDFPKHLLKVSQYFTKEKTSIHLLKFRMNEHKSFSVIPVLKVKKLVMDSSSYSRIKRNTELIH